MGEVHRLKGVFERLYQDSIQRIQRLGLIRERMVLANRAYSAVVDAMVDNRPADDSIPDLSRLNATTSAALRGMWYHTEYLFRHACEYAMGQGIEASLLKGNRPSLGDIMDDDVGLDDPLAEGREALHDQSTTRQVRRPARLGGDRPLARRTERPGVSLGQRGHPLGGQHSSAQAPWSLKRAQTAAPDGAKDSVSTSFASYMSAMKDASSTDGWANDDRQAATRRQLGPGLVASGGEKLDVLLGTKNGMKIACKSESLPVLPK